MEGKKTTREINTFEMEREFREKLKIFLFFVKTENIVPDSEKEKIGMIIAYRPQDAIDKAIVEYPGKNIFYQGQSMEVEEFIKGVAWVGNMSDIKKEVELPLQPAIKTEDLSKEKFKAGLLLVLNKFTKEDDKETLLKIINNI
jgi:hypothetical protein